ncbi:hypothetical protein ACG2F4_16685 [Halalkalibaculum sp. DA3122]|uniref:hypothetical protein n=1 Tax=unclassified Halalkalibaculum TaxID=2964617 RepID=UPI003753E8BC
MNGKSNIRLASAFGDKQPVLLLALLLLPWQILLAGDNPQSNYRVQHQAPVVVERSEPVTLAFDIPGLNQNNVQDAFLFYRYDGEISYRQQRTSYDQSSFKTQLTVDNENAGSLEYYFAVELTNGQQVTYPTRQPGASPVRVDIVDRERQTAEIEYTILSPEPGASLPAEDLVIAITLFYDENAVDTTRSDFILSLDNEDISEQARASNYFFSYSAEAGEVAPGPHQVNLQLATPEDTLEVARWDFEILDPDRAVAARQFVEEGGEESTSLLREGQLEMTAQNQKTGGVDNDVLKGNLRLSGEDDHIRYSVYGKLTSQESARLQPQNRYGAELYVGDWLEVQGGHIYPSLSRLSISGRRVQGINMGLHAFNGAVNAQFLYGKMNRKIPNIYNTVQPSITEQSDGTPVDTTYSLSFASGGTGTFERDITGGRVSVGRGQTFQWGLNFLKVRDDTSSLATIRDFNSLMNKRPELASSLDASHLNKLQESPDLLNVSGNPQPKDNVIAGSDLMFNIFDDALRFNSETSVSLLNEDISSGVLTNDQEFDINLSEDISSELDRWAWLIIINENMNTLPLRFQVDGDQTTVESAYFPTSILANQSELNFNMGDNNLRAQYRWIGPHYISLANSTIRRDVAGITLSDRLQLFENRLYVTLGYESLSDNVSDTKEATTNTQTARTNLSWFPVDQQLPRVSVGYMYRNRDNSIALNNPFVGQTGRPENIAVRNFAISGGDTVITANPRFSNTNQVTSSVSQQFSLFDISHDASLNVSYLETEDRFFRYAGTKSSSVNLTVQSRFSALPLNTKLGFNLNTTETLGGLSNVEVLGFNIGGQFVLMDDKLNLDTNVALTHNNVESTSLQIFNNGTSDPRDDIYQPETDDSGNRIIQETNTNLVILRAGAQYEINSHHALMVNLSYTNISNQLSSLNPPDDHSLQARYIYRF